MHHLLTGWMAEMPADGRSSETKWQGGVGGYAVGSESSIAPKNIGTYLPPGGAIGFQAHYTPFGKEEVDKSQIALYFYDKPPEMIMHNVVIMDPTIVIPANAAGTPRRPMWSSRRTRCSIPPSRTPTTAPIRRTCGSSIRTARRSCC